MVLNDVTATISTKGRMFTTLPLVLTSLINQTVKPCRLIIYDDNPVFEDLRENEIYKNLFFLMNRVGIKWEHNPGERKGQVFNHQRALGDTTTDWIWRLDDDNIMESNVLEGLYNCAQDKNAGAVGPLILDPKFKSNTKGSNKMKDIFLGLNIQWYENHTERYIEVEHLQGSTFLFRRKAARHGYDLSLSKVGHREETIFTYEIKRAGWPLIVLTDVKTWHLRFGAGGIRSQNDVKLFEHDERIFHTYLKKWESVIEKTLVIPLDNGLGDHYAIRSVLPDIRKANPGCKIIIGACYPDVFEGETGLEIISLAESCNMVNADTFNIYRWMDQHNWSRSVSEAFKMMYS